MKILSTNILQQAEGPMPDPVEVSTLQLATDSGLVFEITQGPEPNSLRIRTNGRDISKGGGMYGRGRLVVAPDCSNTVSVHAVDSGWTWADHEEKPDEW